jgi:5-methylcytosine-specific restriction endonuclease McrA
MPQRVPAFRAPRVRMHRTKREENRPNAYQRGYVDSKHFAWRQAVLLRDNWQCQDCGRICGNKREAHADHISPIVAGTDHCEDGRSRYDVDGGQCLCVRCHSRKTASEQEKK